MVRDTTAPSLPPSSTAVREFYDRFSVRYLLRDFNIINLRHRAIAKLCRTFIPSEARVLEVGCGAGILTRVLQGHAREVMSLDISEKNILVASTYAPASNTTFHRADITELSAADLKGSFDAVLIADVIEHIPLDKHAAVFRVIESALSGSGIVILTFPTPEYQEHLKASSSPLLQAVDETVTLRHLLSVCSLSPIYFSYRNIFGINQYAHLVLARDPQYSAQPRNRLANAWLRVRSAAWYARNASFRRRVQARFRESGGE